MGLAVSASDLFTSIVSHMQLPTIARYVAEGIILADTDALRSVLAQFALNPALLDDVDVYSVIKAVEHVDAGKARFLINTPGGVEWVRANIGAVRAFYAEKQAAAAAPATAVPLDLVHDQPVLGASPPP